MWIISSLDALADKTVRLIRGHECARAVSYYLDRLATQTTALYDKCTIGGPDRYVPVNGANVHEARKFRRKYVLPRRRLARKADRILRWERLAPGEDTANSRTYQECDIPLSSLSEFGEGWVLYFWTLKMVGFVCVVVLFVAVGSWNDMVERRGRAGNEPDETHRVTPQDLSILNSVLSRLGSAECVKFSPVCMDDQCAVVGLRHVCPAPHPINAVCNILSVGIFALFVMALRRTHMGTSHYVKSAEGATAFYAGLKTEDYAVLVENPPADADDPDEWQRFFAQFGPVAYVTVAKADGNLVWKCLEPRALMTLLYRDNPNLLDDKISVVDEKPDPEPTAPEQPAPVEAEDDGAAPVRGPYKRSRKSVVASFSLVEKDDVVLKGLTGGDGVVGGDEEEDWDLDVGDDDALGGPEDSVANMAPWYSGGNLELTPDILTMAADLERKAAEAEAVKAGGGVRFDEPEPKKPLRMMTMRDPFIRYTTPYIFARWLRYEIVNGFPHYFGTMRQVDRDMVAQRLFEECPKELADELKLLDAGKKYDTVKIFVIFETIAGRRECLTALSAGGLIPNIGNAKRSDLPENLKFRGDVALVTTVPPAPEQIIWWNLGSTSWQRFKDDTFSLWITFLLVAVAYAFALFVSVQDEHIAVTHKQQPQYLRAFGFALWGQIYQTGCTQTFGWLASQEHHHDEDAKQLSLLLRYSFLKCVTSIIFIITLPKVETLSPRSIATMKTFLYADAVMGPFLRYVDPFQQIKRWLSRFLPNQQLMHWAHLSPAHDIADSYSNIVKTIFLGLFVIAIVPSAPILTACSCLTGYWVDKHAICRMWSWNARAKPAKWTAEAVQNLLGIALVGSMMKTQQLYKNWPFDNLCKDDAAPPVASDALWQAAGAASSDVWGYCTPPPTGLMGRRGHTSLNLWLTTSPWMSPDHARAIHIYSVGAVIITVTLVLYFWGRTALDLATHLFRTNVRLMAPREDEARMPTFTDHGSRRSAYIPSVNDGSFMFPFLATDTSLMDLANIPWLCDYDRSNLAHTLGSEYMAKGLHHRFSVVKRYNNPELQASRQQRSNMKSRALSDFNGALPPKVLGAVPVATPHPSPPASFENSKRTTRSPKREVPRSPPRSSGAKGSRSPGRSPRKARANSADYGTDF